MIELKDTITIYFDVDDTLIMWDQSGTKWSDKDEVVIRPDSNYPVLARPHHEHIKLLKKHKQHGEVVIVWSAGGAQWAADVVRALKLEDYVDVCASKPEVYYDDMPIKVWMPSKNSYKPFK